MTDAALSAGRSLQFVAVALLLLVTSAAARAHSYNFRCPSLPAVRFYALAVNRFIAVLLLLSANYCALAAVPDSHSPKRQ